MKRPDSTDWHIGGQDIDDLRLYFIDGAGSVGVRSPQAGIEQAAMYEPIKRNAPAFIRTVKGDAQGRGGGGITEDVGLRCGPVYVANPDHVGTGYELTDRHRSIVRQMARTERMVLDLHRIDPRALVVLKLVYLSDSVPDLQLFDTEPGDHGAKVSNLIVPTRKRVLASVSAAFEASKSTAPLNVWLASLVRRIAKARHANKEPDPADAAAFHAIGNEAADLLAASSRAWLDAKSPGRPKRDEQVNPAIRRGPRG